jgi:putative RecB family exonuclease
MEKKMMDKKTIIMSATRMQMYLTCKWKYYCNYVLHLPRKPNVSFKLGIAVHDSLALAGDIWKAQEKFTVDDIAKIKEMYNKIAAREGIADTNIYHEGLAMVMSRVNNFANGTILTIEDKFRVTTDEGVLLTGAMDKVEEINEDTILVVDYKTSKYFETASELKSDIQLSVYDVVASIKYPHYKRIILSLDYLRSEPVYTYRTIDERKGFMEYMLAIYAEMLKLKKEKCVPTLNDMCNWCDFTDNCTAYQEAMAGKSFIKKKPEEYNNEELVKDYLDVKSRKRILDNRERQLKEYILEKIQSDEEDLIGQGKVLYIRQNGSTTYDPKSVYESMPLDEFLNVIKVSKQGVDEFLVRNPVVKAKIMEKASKNYTSPFLAHKNLK